MRARSGQAAAAYGVYPERLQLAESIGGLGPPRECWLGGERHGVKIDSFDGDNSPRSYLRSATGEQLVGKTLLFTTTNGSKAAQAVKPAHQLLLGSFVNLSAVREHLLRTEGPVLLQCSGTSGERSDEDELFAGLLALQVSWGDWVAVPRGLHPPRPNIAPAPAALLRLGGLLPPRPGLLSSAHMALH
jgi:hypothetical protein